MLPDSVTDLIQNTTASLIADVRSVSGGDINQAAKVTLDNGSVIFVKWHHHPPQGMFPAEAHGLALLASAEGLRVPAIYFATEACLGIEWLGAGGHSNNPIAHRLGEGLARQHRFTGPHFGLDRDNYCGLTPQINTTSDDWPAFFGQHRLGSQLKLAARQNRLPGQRGPNLEKLIGKLPKLLPANPPASLLHGDLWGGNWLVTTDNEPALIDPAVYFGHREADLAFTELFGGFPDSFYQAYQSAWALEPGYPERREIYNLYHLLNHLNLFGESYGGRVDAVLRRFV